MAFEYDLTEAHRLQLARAFRDSRRVDLSIDCVIEGQMGRAYVDSVTNPSAFKIEVGPFSYFAGDAGSPGGRQMIRDLRPYASLMPSPPGWIAVAKEIHGDSLAQATRYTFSPESLVPAAVQRLLDDSPFRDDVARIDAATAAGVLSGPDGPADVIRFRLGGGLC